MPDILFKCGKCGKHLVVDDAGAGAKIDCPDCKASVPVPSVGVPVSCSCGNLTAISLSVADEPLNCPNCKNALRAVDKSRAIRLGASPQEQLSVRPPQKQTVMGMPISGELGISPIKIHFECPACGKGLFADEKEEGTIVGCPQCQIDVIVPPRPKVSTRPQPTPAFNVAPGANACPQCGEQNRPGRADCWKCGANLKTGVYTTAPVPSTIPAKQNSSTEASPISSQFGKSPDILFRCGVCEKHLFADHDGAGIQTNCPDCNNLVTIPSQLFQLACPQCKAIFSVGQNMSGQTVNCPFCQQATRIPSITISAGKLILLEGYLERLRKDRARRENGLSKEQISEFIFNSVALLIFICVVALVGWGILGLLRGTWSGVSDAWNDFRKPSPPVVAAATGKQPTAQAEQKQPVQPTASATATESGSWFDKFRQWLPGGSSAPNQPTAQAEQKQPTASATTTSTAKPSMPDDQYFDYLKTKFSGESDPSKGKELMQSYLDKYPNGKHMGEATALLETAQSGQIAKQRAEQERQARAQQEEQQRQRQAQLQARERQRQDQERQAMLKDLEERGIKKSPPDKDAGEAVLRILADKWVRERIQRGILRKADYIMTRIEYFRTPNDSSTDCNGQVTYEFEFITRGGLMRVHTGWVGFYHDYNRRAWFFSPGHTSIDGTGMYTGD